MWNRNESSQITLHNLESSVTLCAISQLQIVRFSHLPRCWQLLRQKHRNNLHEICVQVFLRFSDSSKPSQSVSLIYESAWLAGIPKSEENLLKTSCKVTPVTKFAQIFWWCLESSLVQLQRAANELMCSLIVHISLIELESSVIELGSSAIQIEHSLIH